MRVTSREAESATVTQSLTPSKVSALPNFPVVTRVGPLSTPTFPEPEESSAVVPVGSSNP